MAYRQLAEMQQVPSFPSFLQKAPCPQLPCPLCSHDHRGADRSRQQNGSSALLGSMAPGCPMLGGDTSFFLSCAWDERHESCEHLLARQTDLGSCPALTVLEVDGRGRGFACPPSRLGQIKKYLPDALIFRPKPYFLWRLNYILAWHYLFSMTQINVWFNYLCQTECRENSALVENVGFTAVEMETPYPTQQLF